MTSEAQELQEKMLDDHELRLTKLEQQYDAIKTHLKRLVGLLEP